MKNKEKWFKRVVVLDECVHEALWVQVRDQVFSFVGKSSGCRATLILSHLIVHYNYAVLSNLTHSLSLAHLWLLLSLSPWARRRAVYELRTFFEYYKKKSDLKEKIPKVSESKNKKRNKTIWVCALSQAWK